MKRCTQWLARQVVCTSVGHLWCGAAGGWFGQDWCARCATTRRQAYPLSQYDALVKPA